MVNGRLKFEIIEKLEAISENANDWQRELDPVRWNDHAPKYDIHD